MYLCLGAIESFGVCPAFSMPSPTTVTAQGLSDRSSMHVAGDPRACHSGLADDVLEIPPQQGPRGIQTRALNAAGNWEGLARGLPEVPGLRGTEVLEFRATRGPPAAGAVPRRTAFEAHGLVDAQSAWQAVCSGRLAPEVYALVAQLDSLQLALERNLEIQRMLTYIPPRRRKKEPVPILQRSRWFGIPKSQPRAHRRPDPGPESDSQ